MAGYGGFSILDYDGEKSSLQFYTGNITVASLPGTLTQFGALRDAINEIILGTISSESLKVFDTKLSNVTPTAEFAQRETKWLVVYEDNLPFFDAPVNAIPNEGFGKIFTFEIATADLSHLQTGTDKLDLSVNPGADFVAAFEAFARSPYGGTTNVLEVRHVGRNL